MASGGREGSDHMTPLILYILRTGNRGGLWERELMVDQEAGPAMGILFTPLWKV